MLGLPFGARPVAAVMLFVAASALVWAGVGLLGFALYNGFVPLTGSAWGAALIAATLLLFVPIGWAMIALARSPSPKLHAPEPRVAQKESDVALGLLADLAKDKPLLAMLVAGLLGAAETLRARRE